MDGLEAGLSTSAIAVMAAICLFMAAGLLLVQGGEGHRSGYSHVLNADIPGATSYVAPSGQCIQTISTDSQTFIADVTH